MKKLILFLAALALIFPSLSQVVEGPELKIHNIEGYIYSHGSTGNATADSTLFFSVDNTTIQDEDLSNANIFTLNSGNTREIPDPVGRSGRIMFIKNGTGANVSLTLVSSTTMWADTLEGGGTIAPGELLMLVSDGEYWYARSPETFASVKTDSITSRTNNTDLKLVGQGTGLIEIEGAYTLPGVDGTSGYLVKTDGSGAWGYVDPATITPSGAALTKTDDTNVTLTLGGTPSTALLEATSLTLGWTGNLAIGRGGTGSATASGARTSLGLAIGSDVQAWDAQLDDISGLAVTDGNIIVADGANWIAESGATARTSLGAGDVNGPGSSTDNTIPRFDGTSGKLIQGSSVEIDDSDNIDTNGGSVTAGAGSFTTISSTLSQDATTSLTVTNSNVGVSASSRIFLVSNGNNLIMESYGDGHSTRSETNWINSTAGSTDLVLATGGVEGIRLDASQNTVLAGSLTSGQITSTALTGTGDQILYATSGGGVTRSSVDLADISSQGTNKINASDGSGGWTESSLTLSGAVISNSGGSVTIEDIIMANNEMSVTGNLVLNPTSTVTTPRNFLLASTATAISGAQAIGIENGVTAPSANLTNGVILYAEDVAASSELKVRDEAGNITVLSPHNFSMIPEGRSEEMAWSFYSERDGKYINVDMAKAIRTIERQSKEIEELKALVYQLIGEKYEEKESVKLIYKGTK